MATAAQVWGNPYVQQGARTLTRHYLPRTAAQTGIKVGASGSMGARPITGAYGGSSIKSGFKPVGGATGYGIGVGSEMLGNYLKPKEDQPIYGGEYGDITDKYTRRLEGAGPGIMGGMVKGAGQGAQYGGWYGAGIGAIAGGIIGAATKNATTAYSDFKPGDARNIITEAYQKYLGRDPEAGAVEDWMTGQGWKPGDKGVGQYSLFEKLDNIRNSEEARQRSGINTAPGNNVTQIGNWRPGPIAIPEYFRNSPEAQELANRILQRSRA